MPIQHKRSAVAGKVPLTTDLDLGELAVNTTDGKLFLKRNVSGTESVVEVGPVASVAGRTGTVTLSKSDVGLGNVDNTSDASKPVSTATQTALDAKAPLASPSFTGLATFVGIAETVQTLSGTSVTLAAAGGTVKSHTLTGNTTYADGLNSGEAITLLIDDGTGFTVTWPTMTWVGGSAPTLATTGFTVVVLWQVGAVLYGAHIGNVA